MAENRLRVVSIGARRMLDRVFMPGAVTLLLAFGGDSAQMMADNLQLAASFLVPITSLVIYNLVSNRQQGFGVLAVFVVAVILVSLALWVKGGAESTLQFQDYVILALLLYSIRMHGFAIVAIKSLTVHYFVTFFVSLIVAASAVWLSFSLGNKSYVTGAFLILATAWTILAYSGMRRFSGLAIGAENKKNSWHFVLIQLNGVIMINSERIFSSGAIESLSIFKLYWPLLLASTVITMFGTTWILSNGGDANRGFMLNMALVVFVCFAVVGCATVLMTGHDPVSSLLRICFVGSETYYALLVAASFSAFSLWATLISSSVCTIAIALLGPTAELLIVLSLFKIFCLHRWGLL